MAAAQFMTTLSLRDQVDQPLNLAHIHRLPCYQCTNFHEVGATPAFGIDDALDIIACLPVVALSASSLSAICSAFSGRNVWNIPYDTFVLHHHRVWTSELIYHFSSCVIEVSMLLFCLRWFGLAVNIIFLAVFISRLYSLRKHFLDAF